MGQGALVCLDIKRYSGVDGCPGGPTDVPEPGWDDDDGGDGGDDEDDDDDEDDGSGSWVCAEGDAAASLAGDGGGLKLAGVGVWVRGLGRWGGGEVGWWGSAVVR